MGKQNSGNGKKGKNRKGIERREFIKLGASGMAVTLTGCAVSGLMETDEGNKDSVAAAAAKSNTLAKQETPEVGKLIDPERARTEYWQEPWTWRPEQWPNESLELNVIRLQNPGPSTSPGNPVPAIFSYNGSSPAPTVRVRNDGEVRFKVRNTMGLNRAETVVGYAPEPIDMTDDNIAKVCSLVPQPNPRSDPDDPLQCFANEFPEQYVSALNPQTRPGWNMGGHANGLHGAHTTNLHTHGLHVFPQTNPDGTHSDNVFLRIIPKADMEARLKVAGEGADVLSEYEHVGQLDYRIQLSWERDGESMSHPPGTHWYHPHCHGATHDQVGSGMAGFLIVEGDVDESINTAMTGEAWPDPEARTGPYDYRERLMFLQRAFLNTEDLDAGPKRNNLRFPFVPTLNGVKQAQLIHMRPGAVERWRVLNGSIDGAGTIRFMVLEGQYVQRDEKIWRVVAEGQGEERKRRLEAVSEQQLEDAKTGLHQMAVDGITLVKGKNGKARHWIKDLSLQSQGTKNPFVAEDVPGENEYAARLKALESVFKDGDSLRRSFVRPNEVYMTNANRTDLFFKAPVDSSGTVFTIIAREAHIHTDNHQRFLQKMIKDPASNRRRPLFDVVMAYIDVKGKPVEGGDFSIQSLNKVLPPVPPLLQPVREDELRIPANEASVTGAQAGSSRTRTISYSGAGGADFPIIQLPEGFAIQHAELEDLLWSRRDGVELLQPNLTRTMAINTEFDLKANPEPGLPRKFAHGDPNRSRILLNTAEEWVLYNCSMTLWANRDLERFPQPGSWKGHCVSYPISRKEGQKRFAADHDFMITNKGNDHPFHIHVNPMWVLRIDVPDENGDLHNILPEPVWMDTVAIPRNGGRVVFRSRFEDFTGQWVNHCHLLMHEDMGMMQVVECTDKATESNYQTRDQVSNFSMSGADVDAIYPKPSLELMYTQNMSFIDPNEVGYQVYPGFKLEVPKL